MKSSAETEIVIPELEEIASNYKPRQKMWTEKEDAILRSYCGRVHIRDVAKVLDRSIESVRHRIQRLGMEWKR